MPALFEGAAASVVAELTAEVRAGITAELARFERSAETYASFAVISGVRHLHAEGYCLRVRRHCDGRLAVFELSVRCARHTGYEPGAEQGLPRDAEA